MFHRYLGTSLITFFKRIAFNILTKDRGLKHFDNVKLSPSLHFQSLEFRYFIFKVKNNNKSLVKINVSKGIGCCIGISKLEYSSCNFRCVTFKMAR